MKNAITVILLFVSVTVFSQGDCKDYKENYIPKNLKDAIEFLNCEWSESDKTEFKNKEEDEAVTELHFGTGMGIRNGWELWKGKNRISRFFKSKGITHPDDMSSIILTSFHRDLNNKPIDLEGQISVYQEYWNKLKNKKKSLKQKFKELEIGTVVQVAFSGSWRYDGTDTTTLHSYLYTADDSSDFECLIEGKVIEKIKKKKRYNLTIKITNCDSCEYKNPVFNKKKVETGKTMVVDMAYEKVIIK
ncbi:hypothetical protein GYB29_10400 [bacterium]|jgi:predicted Zn-ribbon and HTH transcriptional regulator|nr:hypothetical protein [bacterium]